MNPSTAATLRAACLAGVLAALAGLVRAEAAPAAFPDHLVGDVGAMAYASSTPLRGDSSSLLALPYGYFDYQRFFARIDTFGIKGCRLGYGHVEAVGRIAVDGVKTDRSELRGLAERRNSLPLGLGSFQLTPIGAFFIYAFHDFGDSHGSIYELSYVAKFDAGSAAVYPQLGVDYRSKGYLGYYYGVTPAESAASGYAAYQPGGGSTVFAALMLEIPFGASWYGNVHLRRDWLPAAAYDSPLLKEKTRDSAFIALAYRFK